MSCAKQNKQTELLSGLKRNMQCFEQCLSVVVNTRCVFVIILILFPATRRRILCFGDDILHRSGTRIEPMDRSRVVRFDSLNYYLHSVSTVSMVIFKRRLQTTKLNSYSIVFSKAYCALYYVSYPSRVYTYAFQVRCIFVFRLRRRHFYKLLTVRCGSI